MTIMQTYSGVLFDLLNPDPDSIFISDIAHSLARLVRFNGHAKSEYSVAQHCLLCSEEFDEVKEPGLCLEALMHDAHEAYTGDITTPMAQALGRFMYEGEGGVSGIKSDIQHAISKKLNLYDLPGGCGDEERITKLTKNFLSGNATTC